MEKSYIEGRVSVIIPVYNAEKYIDQTLMSVFSQTYKEIEIVLVDDCSVDSSVEIISKHMIAHPEIVYFRQPENLGAGAARNKALELSTGQYIAFLDSDDFWLPEKTERQIALMKQKNSPFSYTAIEMVDGEDRIIKKKRDLKESCNYHYLLNNTIIATSSVIVDRLVFGDFRMPLRRGGQDYATWLMLLRNGTEAYGINEALVRYRMRSDSLSSNKLQSIKQVWEIQTKDEGINKIVATYHTINFVLHALKKYIL